MVKMADSPMIRQYMPTRPRDGRGHSCSRPPGTKGIALIYAYLSVLVLPVRVFVMLQIPQRPTAAHHRLCRKVIGGRRRGSRPFERPRVPRIVARNLSLE